MPGHGNTVTIIDTESPSTQGALIYGNGTTGVELAVGSAYQVLQVNAAGTAPAWAAINVRGTAPTLPFYDTDAAAGDINAQILAQATDTGNGTEDVDVTFSQQIAGTLTAFLTADADGSITFGAGRTVNIAGLLNVGTGLSTEDASVQIGEGRSGDGASYVDLVADGVTYTDYGFRMLREAGANGLSSLQSRGTGVLRILTVEAAQISFMTTSLERAGITAAGQFFVSLDSIQIVTSQSPASNGAGAAGEIAWDGSYLYVCTATNTWARAALTGAY